MKVQETKQGEQIEVRRFRTDESGHNISSLVECTKAAIESGGGFGWIISPGDEALVHHWTKVTHDEYSCLFCACDNSVVVGSVQLLLPQPKNEAGGFVGEVSTLFVHPQWRGRGIASMLLEAVEEKARSFNWMTQLNLSVRQTQTSALGLYLKHRFQRWGINPRYACVEGKYIAGHYMSKRLDSSA